MGSLHRDLIRSLDATEIEEIREEDRYLAEQLETLVKGFEERFLELNVSLSQFVEKYLWPKLDEIEEERDEVMLEAHRLVKLV
ncbi:hypothetical protein F5Y05DRAFT_369587 [Hypoxylon sp. FL0543]|nr:hypothetical protein F5Y05DRAFT_369587 [Hypoxylon sp. FL0543]